MTRTKAHILLAFALSALLCASCGRSTPKPVYPVSGQVLFNNKPPVGAQVVFHPVGETGQNVVRPHGEVDESGQFTLSTYGSRDGAPTGEYFVTVEWWQARQTKARDGDDSPPINRLPARYADAQGSKLRVQVTEGTNELGPFRLTR